MHVVAGSFGQRELASGIITHLAPRVRSPVGFAKALEGQLNSLAVDVIHDMGFGWYCDVFQPRLGSRRAYIESCLARLPLWQRAMKRGVMHVLPRYRRLEHLMKRQYQNDGRLCLALSKRVASHFTQYHQVPAEKTRLVYNGVDLEQFLPSLRKQHRGSVRQQLGASANQLVVLISAHNFKLKGVDTAVRASGRLRRGGHPVLLVVAGRDKKRAAYQRMARGCRADVRFAGNVANMSPYYAAADVYVHPTQYDACSRSVLEALASGLPVVASSCDGSSELITPGKQGFILDDPSSDVDLADRLRPFFDHQVRHDYGQAARALAEEYSLDRMGLRIEEIYGEIMEDRSREREWKLPSPPTETPQRWVA